jgi:predicted aldo/keto reductase-like oxidoreductase
MEPLRGGSLARTAPPAVAKEWDEAEKRRSCVEWALDWLWNQEAVSLVLSGMSTLEQTEQNVNLADRSGIGMLSAADLNVFKKVIQAYRDLFPIPCTSCKYCQPCPNGVNIPRIFEIYNERMATEDPNLSIWYATDLGMPSEQRASNCTECGECVNVCPQKIDIPEQLKKIHADLTRNNPFGPSPSGAVAVEE